MNTDIVAAERLHWYAIYTHSRQEERAEHNLRVGKVETFNPKAKEIRKRQSNPNNFVTSQLFPRYIFARFVAKHHLHKVSYTRGVQRVVSFSSQPTPVDDSIISLIRSQMDEDGYVPLGEQFKSGDRIVVKDGSLANFAGVFERELKGSDRVSILLTTVSYQVRVVLEREQIQKLPPAGLKDFAIPLMS